MSDIKTIIKYTGAAVDGKSMDVSDLAPSLIALSDLLKIVNKKHNGERAGLKCMARCRHHTKWHSWKMMTRDAGLIRLADSGRPRAGYVPA